MKGVMMRKHISSKKHTNIWQIQEAKAKFSEVIEKTKEEYQTITKNGEPVAVIISKKDFDKIAKPKTSLLEFFKNAPFPEIDLDIERSRSLPREIDL